MVVADPGPGLSLVLGGSRSGKSRWAEHLASLSGLPVLYVATAAERPGDSTWSERLALHRQRRPSHWGCLECGAALAEALDALQDPAHPHGNQLLLIDSLGTWLAQHLDSPNDAWESTQAELLCCLSAHRAPVLLVCEEVGSGVVPATAVGNRFRDRMGALQQCLMRQASASWLVVAGRALDLHALGHLVPAED